MTLVPTVAATAVPSAMGPARLTNSRSAATRGVTTRPEVKDAIRLPPSLKPETSPNIEAAINGAIASKFKLRSLLGTAAGLRPVLRGKPGLTESSPGKPQPTLPRNVQYVSDVAEIGDPAPCAHCALRRARRVELLPADPCGGADCVSPHAGHGSRHPSDHPLRAGR